MALTILDVVQVVAVCTISGLLLYHPPGTVSKVLRQLLRKQWYVVRLEDRRPPTMVGRFFFERSAHRYERRMNRKLLDKLQDPSFDFVVGYEVRRDG